MRERGSNTARPTEKGGGGLTIGSRFGRFGRFRRVDSVDWVDFGASIGSRLGRDSVDFGASIRSRLGRDWVDSVAICRLPLGVSCRHSSRHPADKQPTPCRHSKTRHKKSPIPQSGNRAAWRLYASRFSIRLLIPRANTCVSVRGVLRGLARRSCIVMLTSGRRHIVHYTLQNMRTHGQS